MAWLKVYQWEHEKFPAEQKIDIKPQYRKEFTYKIAKALDVDLEIVELNLRGRDSGRALNKYKQINLSSEKHKCSLGVILHEIAHLRDNQRNSNSGHEKTFKKTLIDVYVEYKSRFKYAFEEIRQEEMKQREIAEKQMQRELMIAQKKQERKQFMTSDNFKIQRLQARIKRLETKHKRIGTILIKAKRSLARLQKKQVKDIQEVK